MTSRSLKIPSTAPPSAMRTAPMFSRSIVRTASKTVAVGSSVTSGDCAILRSPINILLAPSAILESDSVERIGQHDNRTHVSVPAGSRQKLRDLLPDSRILRTGRTRQHQPRYE